jgi:hypothetical protein
MQIGLSGVRYEVEVSCGVCSIFSKTRAFLSLGLLSAQGHQTVSPPLSVETPMGWRKVNAQIFLCTECRKPMDEMEEKMKAANGDR